MPLLLLNNRYSNKGSSIYCIHLLLTSGFLMMEERLSDDLFSVLLPLTYFRELVYSCICQKKISKLLKKKTRAVQRCVCQQASLQCSRYLGNPLREVEMTKACSKKVHTWCAGNPRQDTDTRRGDELEPETQRKGTVNRATLKKQKTV